MGYFGCLGLLIRGIFWVLLYAARDEMSTKWTVSLAAFWLVGYWASLQFPSGPYLFMSAIALIDVALVLVVFGGDIRIT